MKRFGKPNNPPKLKLNDLQLDTLRVALATPKRAELRCDRETGKALVARGFAYETAAGAFCITLEGRERARFAADCETKRDGIVLDANLMRDLPDRTERGDAEGETTRSRVSMSKLSDVRSETDEELRQKIRRLEEWVADLQSVGYVNCVYCGHRYGREDNTAVAMADVLKRHIATCASHPMARLLKACKLADHTISSLLAVRDGIPNEALTEYRDFIHAAIEEAKS